MFKLWFVKFEQSDRQSLWDIKFCFTLPMESDEQAAEKRGREMINPKWVDDYRLAYADVICHTPDEVLCFEPC